MKIMCKVQEIARQGESEFPLQLLSEARWPVIPSTSLIPGFVLFLCCLYWHFTHETQNQNPPLLEVRALLCPPPPFPWSFLCPAAVTVLPGEQTRKRSKSECIHKDYKHPFTCCTCKQQHNEESGLRLTEPTLGPLTPTHRGSATLQVLCSYLSYSPHHCLAMAWVGSPFRATINQENLGHRNKKYL